MQTVEMGALWLHIAAGTVAILAGIVALVTTKGGWRHRHAGKVFLTTMGLVVGTVFVLVAIEPTTIRVVLTLVAVFSGYLALSGYRTIARKSSAAGPHPIDWIAAGLVVSACLVLGAWGIIWLLDGTPFGLVMVVFGAIGIGFGVMDGRSFHDESRGNWMVSHLQRMVGAFIATVSAVSAVNLSPMLGVVAWLWPTIVGIPLIAYWSNKYAND